MPSAFESEAYAFCRQIPRGYVTTYGEIARAINSRKKVLNSSRKIKSKQIKNTPSILARAVGNALNKNPYAPNVPCHRVVRSDGHAGRFAFGSFAKEQLLRKEGIIIIKNFAGSKTSHFSAKFLIPKTRGVARSVKPWALARG